MKYTLNNIDTRGKENFDLSRCLRLDELKEELNASLPEYEDFVMKYGGSEIADMIRVYAPDDVLYRCEEFRERVEQYFLWDNDDSALSEEELQECFPLADTNNGDEFVFKTGEKSGIYCLPQDDYTIYSVGKDLQDIVDFAMFSGKVFNIDEYYSGNPPERLFISET